MCEKPLQEEGQVGLLETGQTAPKTVFLLWPDKEKCFFLAVWGI